MKRLLALALVGLAFGGAVMVGRGEKPAAPDEAARAAVRKLFASLSTEQKKLALTDFTDKERYKEAFPGVKRPGLPFTQLTDTQKSMVEEVVRRMTSEYGAERCLAVAKQSGPAERYVNFFGDPTGDGPFAWRLAQHHLTLIYAEFGKGKADEFGPILLGGNPVKDIWAEEEKLALALFAALSAEEHGQVVQKGGGASGSAVGKAGLRIGDLSEKAKPLAHKLLRQRLAVFSADRRKAIDAAIERDGGADALRIAFWGDASKSHRDGGRYDWKIGGDRLLFDWQTVGKDHIHMTARGRAKA